VVSDARAVGGRTQQTVSGGLVMTSAICLVGSMSGKLRASANTFSKWSPDGERHPFNRPNIW
jgi:hypothetical protein